jgi:hypothetical protein
VGYYIDMDATQTANHKSPKGRKGNIMIRMIVATKHSFCGWDLVGRARLSKNGRGPVAKKLQGSQYSYCLRQAAQQFGDVASMQTVGFKIGSECIRVIQY